MLKNSSQPGPVDAVLKIDMLIEGDEHEAGTVIELSARDFKYQFHLGRVLPATKENIAAVKAEVAAKKAAAEQAADAADELTSTKAQLAAALAEVAALRKGK